VLRKVFPDATVAITHRDPVSVIQSAVTMLAYGQRVNRRQVDPQGLIHYWTERVLHLLRACVNDRATLPAGQSIDVLFHEFMADDLGMVERIYTRANLALTPRVRECLQAHLDAHPRGKEGRVIYNLRDDFGVTPAQLRARFAFYCERFPVQAEVH